MATNDDDTADDIGHVQAVVISWADLTLDPENPRLEDGGDTNRETLNSLIESDPVKQFNLAKDIASTGRLNPLDLIGVVEEDELYVVVEGNRRIAALKMLKSPDLIDDSRFRRRIAAIAKEGTGPNEVTCSWFETRAEADRWILLRHRGEQDGRGVVPWDTDMQERFSRDPGSQSDLARQVRALMLLAYPTDADLEAELESIFRGGVASDGRRLKKRPTTLGRLLRWSPVQEAFGFSVDKSNGQLVFDRDEELVHAAFRQMIFDVSEGLTARDVNNADQAKAYTERYPHLLEQQPTPAAPPASPTTPPAAPAGNPPPTGSPGGQGATPGAGNTLVQPPTSPPPVRRKLPQEERHIFDKLKLAKFDLRTSKTLKQAQQLDIDQLPAVTGVMVRVIVELCVTEAIDKLGLNASEGDKLHKKLRVVLKHLDPNIESSQCDKTLEPAWINSQKSTGDGLGLVLMNAFVHGLVKTAAPSEVRTLSREYRPVLERLENELP